MVKYLLRRLLHGALSIIAVVAIVMVLIYTLMDRNLIFAHDAVFAHQNNNQKETYKYFKWEEYGYLDYVTYYDWLNELQAKGEIDQETHDAAADFGRTADKDSDLVKEYAARFEQEYRAKGYGFKRMDAVLQGKKKLAPGGAQQMFAYKDKPLIERMLKYFGGFISVDNIHRVQKDVGERGLTFTLHDPMYGGEKFSPAILGNGTLHRYLLYFDQKFPFFHQNMASVNLGKSYVVNASIDVFTTMVRNQGSYVASTITYPTGLVEDSADDLHTALFVPDSLETNMVYADRFVDDYTNVLTVNGGLSKTGYSFIIGIIAVCLAYTLGVPLGILMARRKDKLIDKIGTVYIIFIIAVPSLAYIFLFKAIGGKLGLPTTFNMESSSKLMYVLPIVSLALPSAATMMKWLRRYMIDQSNADYVKFARSGGLSEGAIFTKHILKNAAIPIVHSIPADVLYALTGAIITERVYVVPGAGNLLTEAIGKYDNGVIVGITLFYALLSVIAIIMGDILMALVDPRISFSDKAR